MWSVTRLSSKSQITLPAWARRELGLQPGSRLGIHVRDGRIVLEPVGTTLSELEGTLKGAYGPDPQAYIDEIRADRSC